MNRLLILFFVAVLASCAPEATTPPQTTFVRSLNDRTYGWQDVVSPDPVRRGVKAQRFEVRAGDCASQPDWDDCAKDRTRSEMSGRQLIPPGAVRWIAFSMYIPEDFPKTDPVHLSLFQLHTKGGQLRSSFGYQPSANPALQVRLSNGILYSHLNDLDRDPAYSSTNQRKLFRLAELKNIRGKWIDIVLRVDTQPGIGSIEAWVNGEFKFKQTGFVQQQAEGHYLKYGIYNTLVSKYGKPMPTQIVYFDEIAMGNSREEVDPYVNKRLRPVD